MNKKLVIFGTSDVAQMAHYYFSTDSDYDVVAFTVDAEYISGSTFCELPVVAFDQVVSQYPPARFDIFVALGYSNLNETRKSKYLAVKALDYKVASYISSHAIVLNDGDIGENCFLLENNTIQPFVKIGKNVTLWSGNHIGHHSVINDHCFVASHVVVSGGVEIEQQCFIGVNATIRDRMTIGEKCVIGAGALILANAEANGVYIGSVTPRSAISSDKLRKI